MEQTVECQDNSGCPRLALVRRDKDRLNPPCSVAYLSDPLTAILDVRTAAGASA